MADDPNPNAVDGPNIADDSNAMVSTTCTS
jgi:hypothetical protein